MPGESAGCAYRSHHTRKIERGRTEVALTAVKESIPQHTAFEVERDVGKPRNQSLAVEMFHNVPQVTLRETLTRTPAPSNRPNIET